MIRLRPRPDASPAGEAPGLARDPARAAAEVFRRFFDVIGRFERRKRALETKSAPEIKARITRLGD